MDRTVVSNTGTTVRRRNAGRTRNTSGKSIFTGAVRARSEVAARRACRTDAASSEVAWANEAPSDSVRVSGDRTTEVGEVDRRARRVRPSSGRRGRRRGPSHGPRRRAVPQARRWHAGVRAERRVRRTIPPRAGRGAEVPASMAARRRVAAREPTNDRGSRTPDEGSPPSAAVEGRPRAGSQGGRGSRGSPRRPNMRPPSRADPRRAWRSPYLQQVPDPQERQALEHEAERDRGEAGR